MPAPCICCADRDSCFGSVERGSSPLSQAHRSSSAGTRVPVASSPHPLNGRPATHPGPVSEPECQRRRGGVGDL